MTKPTPSLSFSVQYGVPCDAELPRWRLRRWAQVATEVIAEEWLAFGGELHGLSLTVRIVDAQEGQSLNREYRQKDYATNVLTFEYGADPEHIWHGDIVLCLPILQAEAAQQGKSLLHHAAHLLIHGCLHAVAYDHEDEEDAEHMEGLEIEILSRLGISDPYQHD